MNPLSIISTKCKNGFIIHYLYCMLVLINLTYKLANKSVLATVCIRIYITMNRVFFVVQRKLTIVVS